MGTAAWAILLRNLWGREARERYPIDYNLWVGRKKLTTDDVVNMDDSDIPKFV